MATINQRAALFASAFHPVPPEGGIWGKTVCFRTAAAAARPDLADRALALQVPRHAHPGAERCVDNIPGASGPGLFSSVRAMENGGVDCTFRKDVFECPGLRETAVLEYVERSLSVTAQWLTRRAACFLRKRASDQAPFEKILQFQMGLAQAMGLTWLTDGRLESSGCILRAVLKGHRCAMTVDYEERLAPMLFSGFTGEKIGPHNAYLHFGLSEDYVSGAVADPSEPTVLDRLLQLGEVLLPGARFMLREDVLHFEMADTPVL
ncbi:MAG: hypothetical protein HY543_00525 [Deltaproteobacteria bacterium]|nr:hypothetical protein [Deltaproteobacteria bacterium]